MIWRKLLALDKRSRRAEGKQDCTELPIAAHIVTSRIGYAHHGIYVGDGKVVHYAGLSRGLRRGPIEEVSIVEFARGRPVRVICHLGRQFAVHEVAARARSRLGEDHYRILSNNCEHFCEWCIEGESRSPQVEAWRMRIGALLAFIGRGESDGAAGAQAARA